MHARQDIPTKVARLAAAQCDVISRAQALGTGLSPDVLRRLLRDETWRRLAPGLYRTLPTGPSWESLAWGGILLGGDGSRLGPAASGHLWGLDQNPPETVDVLVPLGRTLASHGSWHFIRERPTARSHRSRGNPPRLTPEDAVLDLADQRSEQQVVRLVTRAVSTRLTTTERLRRHLELRARHSQRGLLTDMLTDVAEGAESALELRFLRDVERPHGLPRGDRQNSRRGLPHVRDVLYRQFGLLVELDGKEGHEGEGRFRDMNRDNQHALWDEVTLRYGWFAVTGRPCPVAYQVFTVLQRHGYREPFQHCRLCLLVPESDLARS